MSPPSLSILVGVPLASPHSVVEDEVFTFFETTVGVEESELPRARKVSTAPGQRRPRRPPSPNELGGMPLATPPPSSKHEVFTFFTVGVEENALLRARKASVVLARRHFPFPNTLVGMPLAYQAQKWTNPTSYRLERLKVLTTSLPSFPPPASQSLSLLLKRVAKLLKARRAKGTNTPHPSLLPRASHCCCRATRRNAT